MTEPIHIPEVKQRFDTIQQLIQEHIAEYSFEFVNTIPVDYADDAPTVGGYFILADDPDDPLYVVFEVSMLSADVLVMMTDENPLDVSDTLGFILLMQGESHLAIGDVFKIPQNEFLITHEVYACTLLKPATLNYFTGIEHALNINENHYHMLMPVFLNRSEYELGKDDFVALLDHFEGMNRDLLSFSSKPIPTD